MKHYIKMHYLQAEYKDIFSNTEKTSRHKTVADLQIIPCWGPFSSPYEFTIYNSLSIGLIHTNKKKGTRFNTSYQNTSNMYESCYLT